MIEVLVAISLLASTIITISALTISMMRANSINHNHLIATELSREGLELTRIIRDQNWENYKYWLTDIHAGVGETFFTVDAEFETEPYSTEEDARLYKLDEMGVPYTEYAHNNSGEQTPFYRKITVYPTLSNEEQDVSVSDDYILKVLVESKVWWYYKGDTKGVTLFTELTDWNG